MREPELALDGVHPAQGAAHGEGLVFSVVLATTAHAFYSFGTKQKQTYRTLSCPPPSLTRMLGSWGLGCSGEEEAASLLPPPARSMKKDCDELRG